MPNLQAILDEHKENIKSMVIQCGFENPRIYCDLQNSVLQLVVSKNSSNGHYQVALETILIEKLGCRVVVMDEGRLKPLYKNSTLDKSVSIDDKVGLEKMYQTELNKIEIDLFPRDEKNINYIRALMHAYKVLGQNDMAEYVFKNNTFFNAVPNNSISKNATKRTSLSFEQSTEETDAKKSAANSLNPHINNLSINKK